MRNGWTGGQFSLLRIVLALPLVFVGACVLLTGSRGIDAVFSFTLLIWSAFLVFGACVRVLAALMLAVSVLFSPAGWRWLSDSPSPFVISATSSWVCSLAFFAVLLLLPRAPYGSWPARGRIDPGGGWEFPPRLFALVWGYWIAFHVATAASALYESRAAGAALGSRWWLVLELQALFVIFAWSRRSRLWAWVALVAWGAASLRADASGASGASISPWTIALIALTLDPAWIPARRGTAAPSPADAHVAVPVVFFDGGCALCHGVVRFAVAEDRDGTRFRFAPLGGATAARELAAHAPLPDSVVVVADGEVLVRSRAIVRVLEDLGGFWRLASWLVQLVPVASADAAYDFIAARRKRWFAPPPSACPLLPPELARRIDA